MNETITSSIMYHTLLKGDKQQVEKFVRFPVAYVDHPDFTFFFDKTEQLPFLFAQLQNYCNTFLYNYLNSEDIPSKISSLFLTKNIPVINSSLLDSINQILVKIDTYAFPGISEIQQLLIKTVSGKDYEGNVPQLIVHLYTLLDIYIKSLPKPSGKEAVTLGKTRTESNIRRFLRPIHDMVTFFGMQCTEDVMLVLHGSCASGDYIEGLSDCDTLIILGSETLFNIDKLRNVRNTVTAARRYQFQIDPLQHHGHFVITEVDLHWYPETFFPVNLFCLSEKLYSSGNVSLSIHRRDTRFECFRAAYLSYSSIEQTITKYNTFSNAYLLKYFLQAIQMVPVYYQQLEMFTDKKTAITVMGNKFGEKSYKIIRDCSLMREHASYPPFKWPKLSWSILTSNNPKTNHRRAVLLADGKKYVSLIHHYIGKNDIIRKRSLALAEKTYTLLEEIVSTWTN